MLDERFQLTHTQKAWGAAAEVDKVERPSRSDRQAAVNLYLARERLEIGLDVPSRLVGIYAEITELAAFSAKRDVQVETQRRLRARRGFQHGPCCRQVLRPPE